MSISTAIVVAGIINFNTIRTSHYEIEIPKRSSRMDHLKIAFVADFHLHGQTKVHFVERFVDKIHTIQPDLMLFGGDIVEGHGGEAKLHTFERLLNQIKPKYGSFGVLGNHEFYAGEHTKHFFQRAGIKLLNDTTQVIN